MIVILAGLPASGKTTLARELAQRTAGTVLNKDEIRRTLFDAQDVEYSTEQDDLCMRVLFDTATYLLTKHPARKIFIDGRPFSRRSQIDDALDLARKLRQPWRILECICSEASARRRLRDSAGEPHPARNRNLELYANLRAGWEEIAAPKTVIDTDEPFEQCIEQAMRAISE